jgi:RNA polymerase sigma-70 factor (ECF subfamily)
MMKIREDKYTAEAMEKNKNAENNEILLENIMNAHSDMLLRMAFLILKDLKLAEDALQETFINFYYSMGRFRGESSLKTYLCRILINECRQKLRKSWFKRQVPAGNAEDPVFFGSAGTQDPDEQLNLSQGLKKLDVKYREVLLLHYYNDLSIREISEVLGEPEGTVKSKLKRGREKLKALVQEDLFDD